MGHSTYGWIGVGEETLVGEADEERGLAHSGVSWAIIDGEMSVPPPLLRVACKTCYDEFENIVPTGTCHNLRWWCWWCKGITASSGNGLHRGNPNPSIPNPDAAQLNSLPLRGLCVSRSRRTNVCLLRSGA